MIIIVWMMMIFNSSRILESSVHSSIMYARSKVVSTKDGARIILSPRPRSEGGKIGFAADSGEAPNSRVSIESSASVADMKSLCPD